MPLPASKRTVLFVDDERSQLTYYVEAVESAGHRVVFCDTAQQGLKYIIDSYGEIDIIVLDIMMPTPEGVRGSATNEGLDTGIWLLQQVRELIEEHTLPVIVLSNRQKVALEGLISDLLLTKEGLIYVTTKTETSAMKLPDHIRRLCQLWNK